AVPRRATLGRPSRRTRPWIDARLTAQLNAVPRRPPCTASSTSPQSGRPAGQRRAAPGRPATNHARRALGRYLAAVAAAASAKGAEESAPAASPSAAPAGPRPSEEERKTLLVRDVMQVPAASVPGDMPFVEVARTLT